MYSMYAASGSASDVTSQHLTSMVPLAPFGHSISSLTSRYSSSIGSIPGYSPSLSGVARNGFERSSFEPYDKSSSNGNISRSGFEPYDAKTSSSSNSRSSFEPYDAKLSNNTNSRIGFEPIDSNSSNCNNSRSGFESYDAKSSNYNDRTMPAGPGSPVEYLPPSASPAYSSNGSPPQDMNNIDASSTLSNESEAYSSSSSNPDGSSQSKLRKGPKGLPYIPSYMDLSNGPEPCVVCSDAATGYHYRCMTCEGCKGFFRRTIQKNLQYHCKWNKTCVIDKTTRNQCQECRFIKCINVGMATDLVLNERQRTAKRKLIEDNRERRKEETVKVKVRDYIDNQEVLTDYDRGLICEVATAYEFTAGRTKNKSNAEYDSLGLSSPAMQTSDPESWQNLADAMTPSIVKVVEFAKGVPGFIQLNVDDQILLLKSCCMEIMCLRAACRFDPDAETLTLHNGTKLHKSQIHEGGVAILIEPIFEFAIGLAKLKLDKAEIALLAAVLLMQSDRSGLHEPEAVERRQDSILGAFKRYIAENRPYQPVHWAKILMKVTDLRTISTRHAERVLCIRLDNSGEIPPLLLEVFNEGHAS